MIPTALQKSFLPLLLVFVCNAAIAQVIVAGKITNKNNEPVSNASLQTGEIKMLSNEEGLFNLTLPSGRKTIYVSHISYHPKAVEQVLKDGDSVWLSIQLQSVYKTLQEVQVQTSGAPGAVGKHPIAATIIEAKRYYSRSANTADIINTAAGVRVRQDGGLGSRAEFSLNGITGKGIKYFLDGIPLDYLGAASGLNTLSPSVIERIEIYKGVVPVELGADALGGAIQMISRKDLPKYLDATYSIGSFNTHRVSLNSRYSLKNKLYVAGNGFFNYSDNDYKVDVEIPNASGNPEKHRVRRFHDKFKSFWLNAEAGGTQTAWADVFGVGLIRSGVEREIQNNIVMTQPYGRTNVEENTITSYAKWSKKNLLRHLAGVAYIGYNRSNRHFLDTSLNAYTWDGKIANRRFSGGEISGSRNDLRLHTDNVIGRLNLTWSKDSLHSVNANIVYTTYTRKGEDAVAENFYGKDFYNYPTQLRKLVTGLAYQHLFSTLKLTSVSSVKAFSFDADGFSIVGNDIKANQQNTLQYGASQAFKWQPNASFLARVAYEYATRLPDEYELFGDFILVRPNPNLTPEISHNINTGLQLNHPKWSTAVSGFYRSTDNIIYLRSSQFYAQYQNLLKAKITGVEAECTVRPHPYFILNVNGTYQNIINKTSLLNSGSPDGRYYNLRLPNIPYLFGNGELSFQLPAGKRQNRFQWWYNVNYVHWFYLYWSLDGRPDLKVTIPSQVVQNTGTSYGLKNGSYVLSAEVHNMADVKVYDNFSVQRPGRSFHLKLRAFIK